MARCSRSLRDGGRALSDAQGGTWRSRTLHGWPTTSRRRAGRATTFGRLRAAGVPAGWRRPAPVRGARSAARPLSRRTRGARRIMTRRSATLARPGFAQEVVARQLLRAAGVALGLRTVRGRQAAVPFRTRRVRGDRDGGTSGRRPSSWYLVPALRGQHGRGSRPSSAGNSRRSRSC